MPYSLKAIIIVAAVAVVSFFVAELVIPEKSAVIAKQSAAKEHSQAQADDAGSNDGDIPVVMVDPVGEAAAPSPAPAFDPRTAKTADAKVAKAAPFDPRAAKTADTKTVKTEPFDPRATKTADTKTSAMPPPAPAPAVQPAAAAQPPTQKKPGAAPYRIEKAVLCASIQNREPQGISNKFSKDAPAVYYYTHLVGARDSTTVIHRWYQNGKLIQTSILPVKSNYWRTHSRRNLLTQTSDVTGQWRVDVVEPGSNTVMESASFTIE
jgi:hypothetical protein